MLWRRLFDYKFYDYAKGLSAAWIWSRIRRIGRSRYSLFREKLGYLEGGSSTLLQAMKAAIETHGGEIRLKSPVVKVVIEDGKVTGVQVAGQLEPFDKVVSTVPLPYVPRIMPDLPAEVLAKFGAIKNIAVVCVIAKLKQAGDREFLVEHQRSGDGYPGPGGIHESASSGSACGVCAVLHARRAPQVRRAGSGIPEQGATLSQEDQSGTDR